MAQPDLFPRDPLDILAEARTHNPIKWYVGYTGGGDSSAAFAWATENIPGCEALLINTGIGSERARQHVRDTCNSRGVPLTEIRAKEDCGIDYRDIVMEYGFPGPYAHRFMYVWLKERCLDELKRRVKTKRIQNIAIVTGVRREESVRRMGYATKEVNKVGSLIWVNPIYWWSAQQSAEYAAQHGVERSEISKLLGMSGECLCGAYAHKGELSLLAVADPEAAAHIREIEEDVRDNGHDWGWEDKPPVPVPEIEEDPKQHFMPFCMGCEKRHEDLGSASLSSGGG